MTDHRGARFSEEEPSSFLSDLEYFDVLTRMMREREATERHVADQHDDDNQSMPLLEDPIKDGVELEGGTEPEAAVPATNHHGMAPHEGIPAHNDVFEESSSGTRRVTAEAPEVCPKVTASTGRVPRDQEEPNNNNAEQSQRSRRTFMSQITALSTTLSVLSWISAQWTSMINYWNGLGVFSREVVHILQVVGVRDVIEIREIIHELGTNNIIDLISIRKDEWLQACQVTKIPVIRTQRLWSGLQAFSNFYAN